MFKNFLTIALRNLQRQFFYSTINIIGLAVGMACSLVIFLYVYGEWSYDRHFQNAARIYRVGISFFNMGEFADGPELLGEFLPKEFEGIEAFTRFRKKDNELITVGDRIFYDIVYYADSSFFKVFSYERLSGNLVTALKEPSSAVMTREMAVKYFGTADAVGKTIEVGKDKNSFTVTAIVKDDMRNSHLKSKVWVSYTLDAAKKYIWTSASDYHYFLLSENSNEEDLRAALDQMIAKDVFPVVGKDMGKQSLDDYLQDPNMVKFHIMPLRDIYLKSRAGFELSPGGNETNMLVFAVVAIFILILAAVNFVNLSTARATRRAKEVGIRKSLGTSRGRLIFQFLLESVLLSFISMMIALGLAELFTFAFFWITGQSLSVNLWLNPFAIITVFIFTVIIGVLAGLYPAFYLTSFQPVKVLKGNVGSGGGAAFRNALVVFQFAISICLIVCTTIIVRQLTFMSNKNLGFNQDNVITIDNVRLVKNPFTLRDEILNHPDVVSASLHSGQPGSKRVVSYSIYQTDTLAQPLSIFTYFGDAHLNEVMGFQLLSGRWFDSSLSSDTSAVVLNESAVAALGVTGNPIGKILNNEFRIIGIVRDFHWESLRNGIQPVAFQYRNEKSENFGQLSQLGVKVRSSRSAAVLQFLQRKWKERSPGEPIQYHFLDQNFGDLLEKESIFGKAIGFFTVLAIFISCLGLFGLSAYTTEQRTKEIGIRKALGASVTNIVVMLNREFGKLVVVAIFISLPLAYLASGRWMEQFAYKATVEFWMYLAGGVGAVGIAIATVAFHSIKASKTNPAETLKCE